MNKEKLTIKRIFSKIFKAIFIAIILFVFYVGLLMGIEAYAIMNSEKIENSAQLNQLVIEEKQKLNIEDKQITVKFVDENSTSYSAKTGENQYQVALSPAGQNKATLKHELFHIADGHCDASQEITQSLTFGSDMEFKIKYLFYFEPKAAIYSVLK